MKVRATYPVISYNTEVIDISRETYERICINGSKIEKAMLIENKITCFVPTSLQPVGFVLLVDSFSTDIDSCSKFEAEGPLIHERDDVELCPRCHDQDIIPGKIVCSSCFCEMQNDEFG